MQSVHQGKAEEKSEFIKPQLFIDTFHKGIHCTLTIAHEVVCPVGLLACLPYLFISSINFHWVSLSSLSVHG